MIQIRKYRKRAGLSQTVLADLIGISMETVSRFERGVRSPRVCDLQRIAEVLGCRPSELIDKEV